MCTKENSKQRLSRRMKRVHNYAKIMSKLILTNINGKQVFLLDSLSDEEKALIDRDWCNSR